MGKDQGCEGKETEVSSTPALLRISNSHLDSGVRHMDHADGRSMHRVSPSLVKPRFKARRNARTARHAPCPWVQDRGSGTAAGFWTTATCGLASGRSRPWRMISRRMAWSPRRLCPSSDHISSGMFAITHNDLEAGLESVSRAEFEESTKLECARRMPQLA